jgi:glycosyltransferase involved in cell wall biosynthesis
MPNDLIPLRHWTKSRPFTGGYYGLKKAMKVLRIIGSMDPSSGGPCQGIRNAGSELHTLGIDTEVVCLNSPDAAFLGMDPFPVHALGPAKKPWNYAPKLIPWLLENLGRFDVVIVHGLWLYLSYASVKALRTFATNPRRTPVKLPKLFLMPHGMLDPYFQKAGERKLKAIRNWIYWKLIESRVVKQADGILFTCQAELELARIAFRPYQPKQEINIGYGIVTPPPFKTAMRTAFLKKCPGLERKPYLLFLSRIHPKKGIDLLIEAYKNIRERQEFLGIDIPQLVIAGPKLETAYGQKIQKIIQDDPMLREHIFLPGMLTGDAKWGAFYDCEAFVLPSHQENFGISVVEALACGKPVLISDQVNIWHEIKATRCGIVAPDTLFGTQQTLMNWMNLFDMEREEMGNKARSTFEKEFSIGPAAKRLSDVLKGGTSIPSEEEKKCHSGRRVNGSPISSHSF